MHPGYEREGGRKGQPIGLTECLPPKIQRDFRIRYTWSVARGRERSYRNAERMGAPRINATRIDVKQSAANRRNARLIDTAKRIHRSETGATAGVIAMSQRRNASDPDGRDRAIADGNIRIDRGRGDRALGRPWEGGRIADTAIGIEEG